MSTQVATQQAPQYAMKKRKRPQPRKNNQPPAEIKSNPSKRHRDRLNTELDRLAQLIPLPTDVVNKLDKLSILRLSVAYLRNKSYSKHIEIDDKTESTALLSAANNHVSKINDVSESEFALQALDGFIMVVTQDFNVFYITSNVQNCLGFPQSDIMYQSMLDLIHAEDRKLFMKQMMINPQGSEPEPPPDDGEPPAVPDYVKHGLTPDMVKDLSQDGLLHRSFICRLRCLHDTSSGFLALHFTGHLGLVPGQNRHSENGTPLPPELGLFLLASPLQTPSILEIRTKNYIFRTKHKLDYTPLGIDQKGRIVLGYTEHELRQQSGYQFIHSADMMHCADAHTKLMRKGQSGLTVFRLLHRANRWQWVTASARLIFSKGIPDYIISTHRPITEQEGEEHLKKRSNAFRFDFTGHASLYASVNPIGAGPPPSNNNKSYGSPPETKPLVSSNGPSTKRARITNGVHQQPDIDPATLFGAQSLQSMENYREGLPMIKTNNSPAGMSYLEPNPGIKTEQDPFAENAGQEYVSYFKQTDPSLSSGSPQSYGTLSPNNYPTVQSQTVSSDNGDSGYSDTDLNHSPAFNQDLASLTENEPPPLHHPPVTANDDTALGAYPNHYDGYAQNGNASYNPPMPTAASYTSPPAGAWGTAQNAMHPNTQPGGTNGPHMLQNNPPYTRPDMPRAPPVQARPMPQAAGYNRLPVSAHAYQQHPQPLPHHPAPVPNHHPVPNHPHSTGTTNQIAQYGNPADMPQYSTNQQQNSNRFGHIPNLASHVPSGAPADMNGYYNQHTTAHPKENVSVLNSVEISSKITRAGEDQLEDLLDLFDADRSNVTKDKFDIQFECQENTIQFDLDKIAAEYQTVNPYGVIQNYVQNNPDHARSIARGTMPEGRIGMKNMTPNIPPIANGINGQGDHFTSCQFENGMMKSEPHQQPLYQPHMMPGLPTVNPTPGVKNEGKPDEPEFNLDDFIEFNIPSI